MPRFKFDIGLEAMTMTETTVTDGVHNLKIGNYIPLKYPNENGTITTGMINKIFVANNAFEEGESYSLFGKVFTVTNPKILIGKGDYIKANFDFSDNTVRLINMSRTEFAPTDIVTEENYDYVNLAALTEPVEIFNLPVKIMHDSDVTVDATVSAMVRKGTLTLKMYIDEISTTEPVEVVDYSCNANTNDENKKVSVTMSHSLYHRNKLEEFNVRVTAEFTPIDYEYTHPYLDKKTPILIHKESSEYWDTNNHKTELSRSTMSIFGKMIELNLPVYQNRPDDSLKGEDATSDDPSYLYDFDVYYKKINNDTEIELFRIINADTSFSKMYKIFLPDEIDGIPITKFHSGLFIDMHIKHIRIPKYLKSTGDGISLDSANQIAGLHNKYPESERGLMTVDFGENTNDIDMGVLFKQFFSHWDNSFTSSISMETIKPYTIGINTPYVLQATDVYTSRVHRYDSGGGSSYWRHEYYIAVNNNRGVRTDIGLLYTSATYSNDYDYTRYNNNIDYNAVTRNDNNGYYGRVTLLESLIEYILMGKTSITLEPGNRDFVEIDDVCKEIPSVYKNFDVSGESILEWIDTYFSGSIYFSIPDTTKYIQAYAFNYLAFAEQGYFCEKLIRDDMYSFSIRNHKFFYDYKSMTVIPCGSGGLTNGLGKNIRVVDKNAFNNCYIFQDLHIPNTARYINLSGTCLYKENNYNRNAINTSNTDIATGNVEDYSFEIPMTNNANSSIAGLFNIYTGYTGWRSKVPYKNPNVQDYTRNGQPSSSYPRYDGKFIGSYYDVTYYSLFALTDNFLSNNSHTSLLTIDAPVKNELDTEDEVYSYVDVTYWTQVSRNCLIKVNVPTYRNLIRQNHNYNPTAVWGKTVYEWDEYYDEYRRKSQSIGPYSDYTYPQFYLDDIGDTTKSFDVPVTLLEPLTIPSHTTFRIGTLIADDLVFEDETSTLELYKKFGQNPYSASYFLDRSYIKLAKYRGKVYNIHESAVSYRDNDNEIDLLWNLNSRHGFESFFYNEDRRHTPFLNEIDSGDVNLIPKAEQYGTTEPLFLANDGEKGIHYSFAGNVFADVLVYPRNIDLGNIDSELSAGYFYDDNVFDPSSFNKSTFNAESTDFYYESEGSCEPFTTATSLPNARGTTGFPLYLHGCTYLPELHNSVFPPCRYHWNGQHTIHMVAKVVGWHSLLDMQQGYGTRLDPGENSKYYARYWWDGNFTVSEDTSNKNFHRDWDTDNEMSDEDCIRRMEVYDSGSYPSDYPNRYWMQQSRRYGIATQNLYFGQGTEIIRKNGVGIYPSLFRRYEENYATIFIPPSMKIIEDDAIIASNYVLYVPEGCTVGELYCTDATVRRLIRTRDYKSHDAKYAEAVEIRYYDVANNMESHYVYETEASGDSVKITGFTDSPETAPEQRKSIGSYLMPSEYNNLPITKINPIFYDNEDVRHVVGEIFPSTNLVEIPDNYAKDCIHLMKTSIPSGVTRIGNNAFEHCLKMYNLDVLSTNITYIGDYAFAYCGSHNLADSYENLDNLTYGTHGEYKHSLYNHTSSLVMRDRTAPNCAANKLDISKCEYIGSYAFFNSNMIKGVVNLPENSSYDTIKEGTFRYCSGITKVVIPPNVKTIEAHAFENMTDLEEIVIPSTVENAELSFFGCIRLKKLIIEPSTNPDAIRNISNKGFWHCMSIDKDKFDISGVNGRIGERAFFHFSFDVEELDFYCNELGEYVISLADIKKITFHRDCTFGALQVLFIGESIGLYGSNSRYIYNISLKDVYADEGVTLTVNCNKNFLGWYNNFPTDQCVGINKFINAMGSSICCCFQDITDILLSDTSPTNAKYSSYNADNNGGNRLVFSCETPTAMCTTQRYGSYNDNLCSMYPAFSIIPIVIPDEYWCTEFELISESKYYGYYKEYGIELPFINDIQTGLFYGDSYYSTSKLIYVKKSVYDKRITKKIVPFDKLMPFGIVVEYDSNGVMNGYSIEDYYGTFSKIKDGGNDISDINLPALSQHEFDGTFLTGVSLSDTVTRIPSYCFNETLLSEESIQSILDSNNITGFGEHCFSMNESGLIITRPYFEDTKGTPFVNKEVDMCRYKYLFLLKKNKDGEICDKTGKRWELIYNVIEKHNIDKIELPPEEELFCIKYTNKDTGNLEYKDMTEEEQEADRAKAIEGWRSVQNYIYKTLYSFPAIHMANKKINNEESVILNDMLLDIYRNGEASEYYDNFIVISRRDFNLPKFLDFSNVTVDKFEYSSIYGHHFFGQLDLESVIIPDTWDKIPPSFFEKCFKLHFDIPESIKLFERNCLNNTDIYGDYTFKNATFDGSMTPSNYSGNEIGTMTFIDCSNLPSGINQGTFLIKSDTSNYFDIIYSCDVNYTFGEEITDLTASSTSSRTVDIVIPDTITKITSPNNGFTNLSNIEVDLGEAQFDESDDDNNYSLFTSDTWGRMWTWRMGSTTTNTNTCKVKKITCNSEYIPRFFCTRNDLIESVVLGDKVKYIDAGFLCGCNVSTKYGAVFDRLTFSLPENIEAICANSFISRTNIENVDLSILPHVALTSDDLHNRVYTDANEAVLSTDTVRGVCECAVNLTLPTSPDVYFPQGAFALTNYSSSSNTYEFTGARMRTVNFNGAERLPNYAFYKQTALESVTASKDFYLGTESSVATDRNHRCFYNCESLVSFPFSHLKGRIGYHEFYGCVDLETPDDNCTFSGITALNAYGEYSDTDTTNVTNNYSGAFKNCTSITKLTFDDTCTFTFVGADFAYGCTALREVRLPKTCMRICSGAFDECTVLGSIIAPEGIVVETNGIFLNTTIHHYNVETGEMID